MVQETVTKAIDLENEGKTEEARQVVANAGELISDLYGLTTEDLAYIEHLSRGGPPKRRWGPIHLVRAGLIEFDGGRLTEHGQWLLKRYRDVLGRRNAGQ